MFKSLILNFFFRNINFHQKIIKNTFWLIFSRFLSGLLRAGVVIYASRILGVEKYGYFSLAMSFVLIFSFLPDFGLTALLTREISKNRKDEKIIFANGLFTFLILSLITLILVLGLKDFLIKQTEARKLILILVFVVLSDSLRELLYSLFRSAEQMEKQAFSYIITNLAILLFSFIFLNIKISHFNLAIGYLLGSLVGLIFTFFQVSFSYFKNILNYLRSKIVLFLFKNSWPLGLSNFLFFLLTYLDTIMLGWFRNIEEIGLYQVSVKTYEFFLAVPSALALTMLPTFSRSIINLDENKQKLSHSLSLALWLALPLSFSLLASSNQLIPFLFGQQYSFSSLSFAFLSLTILFQFPVTILINYAIALNKRASILIFDFISLAFNFFTNLWFIPKYGFVGASITTLTSAILFVFLSSLYFQKKNLAPSHINFDVKILLISFFLFIFISVFKINFLLKLIFALIFYLVSVCLLKIKFLRQFISLTRNETQG